MYSRRMYTAWPSGFPKQSLNTRIHLIWRRNLRQTQLVFFEIEIKLYYTFHFKFSAPKQTILGVHFISEFASDLIKWWEHIVWFTLEAVRIFTHQNEYCVNILLQKINWSRPLLASGPCRQLDDYNIPALIVHHMQNGWLADLTQLSTCFTCFCFRIAIKDLVCVNN